MMSKYLCYTLGPVALTCIATLVFNSLVYIITGVDFLHGDDGARWVALISMTAVSGLIAGLAFDCYKRTPEYKNNQSERNRS